MRSAGNVEHFLRDGGNVKRLLPALAEQHAQFAERDQQHRRAQFVEQSFGDEHEIFVRQRVGVARFIRQIRQFEGLLAIRRDERKAAQIQMMHRLGIEAQPDAARAAKRFDFVQQRLRHDALAVIADDDGGGARKLRFESGEQTAGQFRVQAVARFAVNAHDLLFVRHDAGFDARVPRGDCVTSPPQPIFCSARSFFSRRAGVVVADRAENFRRARSAR